MSSALALCQVPCLSDLLQSGDTCRELRKSDSVIVLNSLHLPDRSDEHNAREHNERENILCYLLMKRSYRQFCFKYHI